MANILMATMVMLAVEGYIFWFAQPARRRKLWTWGPWSDEAYDAFHKWLCVIGMIFVFIGYLLFLRRFVP